MNKHFRFSGANFRKLKELRTAPSAVLRRAGLPQSFAAQARVLLKTGELFALWQAIGDVSPNPAIGLLLGTENRTERFHPIGLAALSSPNFGAAIDRMARYKQLTCPEEIVQQKNNDEWSIQFRWLLAEHVEPPVLVECAFAWGSYNLGRMQKLSNGTSAARWFSGHLEMRLCFEPRTRRDHSSRATLSSLRCLRHNSRKNCSSKI